MQQFVNLCSAAGVDVSRLDLIDMFLIAGKIIQDVELTKKALAMRAPGCGAVLDSGRVQALAAMTKVDRWALRERVLGVVQLKKKA
jgi:hypothetical protein